MKAIASKFLYMASVMLAAQTLFLQTARAQWTWWSLMDVGYQVSISDSADAGLRNGGFVIGQYDLFTSYNINDHLEVLAELVFEAPDGELVVDLERLLLAYTFRDWLTLEAGRAHTPLGYYSNAFHHGRHLESAIGRPLILEFEDEGGLVPAHIVGAWLRGFAGGSAGTIDYTIGILNGQKVDTDNGGIGAQPQQGRRYQ